MAVVLDHTIIPVRDQQEAVAFYTTILGLQDGGLVGPFAVVRVNDTLTLDFIVAEASPSRHYAFAMEADEFDAAFRRIQAAGLPYGDSPHAVDNPLSGSFGEISNDKPVCMFSRHSSVSPIYPSNELMGRGLLRRQSETSGGAFSRFWQHCRRVSFRGVFADTLQPIVEQGVIS